MLRTVYNVNANCISRDIFLGNFYIRLNENEEERYSGALVRDVCNAKDEYASWTYPMKILYCIYYLGEGGVYLIYLFNVFYLICNL